MKICCMCKQELSLDAFNKNRKRKDGLQGQCRECWKVYYKENYYLRGNEKARLLKKNAVIKEKIKALIRAAKNVPCTDCGVSYPPYVMDFDHLDRSEKKFNVSSMANGRRSTTLVQKEIDKCEVVCSNCHRERTWGRVDSLGPDVVD